MKKLLVSGTLPLSAWTAQAAFITQPDAAYVAGTTLVAITGPDGVVTPSLTDGTQTLTFAPGTFITETAGTAGWSTWSSPPDAEVALPRVLANYGASGLTINLSLASFIFGFELEPNPFAVHTFSADFFNGATLLGTQTIAVNGNAGARLFALDNTAGLAIDRVVISTPSGGIGFAIANLRYGPADTPIPEPATVLMMGAGLATLAFFRRRAS